MWCRGRGDVGIDSESMRRVRYGIFFGGKNSSNKFEIKIVGKKRHQCGALAKSISVCAASSVRDKKITHRQAFIDHYHINKCAAPSARETKISSRS